LSHTQEEIAGEQGRHLNAHEVNDERIHSRPRHLSDPHRGLSHVAEMGEQTSQSDHSLGGILQ
jgi:hypothetical protein